MSPERQRHVLLGLAAALVVMGAWRYLDAVSPAVPAAVAAARRTDPAVAPITPVDVQLEALTDGPHVGLHARRGKRRAARKCVAQEYLGKAV